MLVQRCGLCWHPSPSCSDPRGALDVDFHVAWPQPPATRRASCLWPAVSLPAPWAPPGLGWLSTLSPTGPSGCFSLCDAIHQGVVRVHGTVVCKLFPLNYGAPEESSVRLIITYSPERLRTPETDHCRCSWKEDVLARHSPGRRCQSCGRWWDGA